MSVEISVTNDAERASRRLEWAAQDRAREAEMEERARSNRHFVQVYPKGWTRLQQLIQNNPGAARIYAFLAQHISAQAGAVVVSQELIASEIGVHVRTVKRLTKTLEDQGALVRIRVGNGVYAYALDPEEVWRSWDSEKATAAFTTKTLVNKIAKDNAQVRRKLNIMMVGNEPELPL